MKKLLCPLRFDDTKESYYCYENYITMFQKINIELIFCTPCHLSTLKQLASLCDGLLLIGGKDVDPFYYHKIKHPKTNIEKKEDEIMEFSLIQMFYKQNKVIIGICRGIQTINTFFQGTLIQDIESLPFFTLNHMQSKKELYCHDIYITKHSMLHHYLGDKISVCSYHHQCIDKVAPGFFISAISEDGLIEAIEQKNIIAMQWHPEKTNDIHQCHILQLIEDMLEKNKKDDLI